MNAFIKKNVQKLCYVTFDSANFVLNYFKLHLSRDVSGVRQPQNCLENRELYGVVDEQPSIFRHKKPRICDKVFKLSNMQDVDNINNIENVL
jgi:hypothetical protein